MSVQALRQGKRIVGTMVRMIRNPGIVQIAADAGLDFIMVDLEHGPISFETFSDMAKVARSIGMGIFVRVPELARGYVSRIMDCGADGVMVPMISTREEAQALVDWARYAPIGNRGLGSAGVANSFAGIGKDVPAFMRRENELTLAIAQIETGEAIENIEEIAAVEGIDVLLIGPNDLSISLGVPGEVMGEAVQAAIEKVAAAAARNNKVFAMHAGDALLDKWVPRGMRMVMNSLDISVLKTGLASIAAKYKK